MSCGHDWDALDPRGAATTSTGGAGGTTSTTSTGSGGEGATGAGGAGLGGHAGAGGAIPWFDDGLDRRRPLALAIPGGNETLAHFPVPVKLDPTRIDYAVTQSGGADLRFVADDQTTLLAHEIEAWNEGGDSLVWLDVPSLGAAPTTVWMYFGGAPSSTQLPPAGVWANGFVAVWHLAGDLADATGNGHDASAVGGVAAATGILGGARAFDGDADAIDVAASSDLDELFVTAGTVSVWVRATTSGELNRGRILDRSLDASFADGWSVLMSDFATPDSLGFAHAFAGQFGWWTTPPSTASYGSWQHFAISFGQATGDPALYLDGAAVVPLVYQSPAGPPPPVTSVPSRLGGRANAFDRDYEGGLDELRLSSGARSPAWIAAEVLGAQDQLVTVGGEETKP